MARRTSSHLPEDDYLLQVGQLAYMVSSIEGLIMFDLPGMTSYLPESLSAGSLAGKSTGQIAGALADAAPRIDDEDVRNYVELAGRRLASMFRGSCWVGRCWIDLVSWSAGRGWLPALCSPALRGSWYGFGD